MIADGKIRSIGPESSVQAPADARSMDLAGRTAMPGMVGIHDHMFYPSPYGETGRVAGVPTIYNEMGVSFPRLYLAGGVTSVRTTGTLEPYSDLQLKMAIDSGRIPGPQMYVTGPYLEGAGNLGMVRMHWLSGPEDAARTVNYWADEGVHDFRAYMHITRAELAAAVKAAHARGLKVTGHLCAVGFTEAANIGIDDLEDGLPVDTEFDPGKEPDVPRRHECADGSGDRRAGSPKRASAGDAEHADRLGRPGGPTFETRGKESPSSERSHRVDSRRSPRRNISRNDGGHKESQGHD